VVTYAPLAPTPDFRYVGLEPIVTRRIGLAAAAIGLVALAPLAVSHLGEGVAIGTAALALAGWVSLVNRRHAPLAGSTRMGIVPWGVLVEEEDGPRILRWAGVRRIDVTSRRVVVETAHDRFVGESVALVRLERLVEHLDAYAAEQSTPLALDLEGTDEARALEAHEPCCEALLEAARGWLESASASTDLDLPPSGYRRASARAPSRRAVDELRRVLRDRTPKTADPRAFAAAIAAELNAVDVAPELVALVQCPHPIVAAVAKQAARKLGVARAKTGTLDEVAPFLHERDRATLDAW